MKSVFICKKLTDFSNVYFAFCFIKVKKNTFFQTSKTKELTKKTKLNAKLKTKAYETKCYISVPL